MKFLKNHHIPLLLFALSLGVYMLATSNYKPFYSYHHHIYVAEAFLNGRFDVRNYPNYYHDMTKIEDKTYAPFGPTPAIILMPFVALFGTNKMLPQLVGALIGSLNVVLVYLLINKSVVILGNKVTPKSRLDSGHAHSSLARMTKFNHLTMKQYNHAAISIATFVAFGTVHFYSVYIGSTWFFAQIVGMFFLLLAMNLIFLQTTNYKLLTTALAGLTLSLAILSRVPAILALPFFIFVLIQKTNNVLIQKNSKLIAFVSAMLPFFLFQLFYNYARFGNIFQDGHALVYNNYKNFPIPVTIFQHYWPNYPLYNFLDIRNIPQHIYTAFLLLPKFTKTFPYMKFLPFGTSILFTSPLLLLIPFGILKKKKTISPIAYRLSLASTATALMIMFAVFLHFMQGWAQFSYRYLLDFLPFLLIPLASAITRINKNIVYSLIVTSIIMNTLGVIYAQ